MKAARFACAASCALLAQPALAQPALAQPVGTVSISGQWLRALGGSLPASGYFVLRNDSDHVVRLTGAVSAACGSLTLHQTVRMHPMHAMSALDPDNTAAGMAPMVSMQPVAALPIPAHGSVRFAPGGFHLMCEQPTDALRPGSQVEITLRLAGAADLTSQFPVKGPRAE